MFKKKKKRKKIILGSPLGRKNHARARVDMVRLARRLFKRNMIEAGGGMMTAELEKRGLFPDFFFFLKAELTETGNRLNVGHEVKKRIKRNHLVSGSTNWVHKNHLHHSQSSSISSSSTFTEQICMPGTEINALQTPLKTWEA